MRPAGRAPEFRISAPSREGAVLISSSLFHACPKASRCGLSARVIGGRTRPPHASSGNRPCGPANLVPLDGVIRVRRYLCRCGNGISYRKPDVPPRVHISAYRNSNTWTFSVTDNGIGIEPAHLQSIFAPFERLHGKECPGRGLGLAMCRKIVERYNAAFGQNRTMARDRPFVSRCLF